MHTTLPRLGAALITLVFVLAACASETGPQWTYTPSGGAGGETAVPAEPGASEAPATEAPGSQAPATAAPGTEAPASASPGTTEAPGASEAPASDAPPATEAPGASDAPAPGDGEARVIDIEASSAIRFLQGGEMFSEIPVTPGETVIFRIDNTAGFSHNFYIGTDDELQVMGGTTDTGIADWSNGVQELEWVVPEDVSGLRFGCTIPGHYSLMQGDFTISA